VSTLTPIRERVKATPPGRVSDRHLGPSSSVPLVGGAWVARHSHRAATETVAERGAVNEFGYTADVSADRWSVQRLDSGFVAVDEVTGIFGFGDDLNEALMDLAAALVEHREVLEGQGALSPDLQDQLRYLQDLF